MTTDFLLARETLKRKFDFVLFTIRPDGSEREVIFKISKKEFLKQLSTGNFQTKLVSIFPEQHQTDILYIKLDGTIAWIWESESIDTPWL